MSGVLKQEYRWILSKLFKIYFLIKSFFVGRTYPIVGKIDASEIIFPKTGT